MTNTKIYCQYCIKKALPLFCILYFIFLGSYGHAQCPANIGFEKGDFTNWECSAGLIERTGEYSLDPTQSLYNRHTLFKTSAYQAYDYFGDFPVNCPNGSNYSIQLGNSSTGRGAERVSYTFTIPKDKDNFSLIYHYAVVFQNPSHAEFEQPKFTANVFDVSNDTYIGCSSFSFAASANLPGFKESTVKDSVFYKTWTPVTIKLSGYAGKQIRLEFTTNDCTRGGHFGYAYVDVNENCNTPISGNIYCTGDDSLNLVAPFGFSEYHWYGSNFNTIIGTENLLLLKPIPPVNSMYAVEVIPFPGQGCVDTIYTRIKFSPEIIKLSLPKKIVACISNPIDLTTPLITSGSSSGLTFEYYINASLTNYLATPKTITKSGFYYIKASNDSGCVALKGINLVVGDYPVFTFSANPQNVTRPGIVDLSAIVNSTSVLTYTYFKDSAATIPQSNPKAINQNGKYFIKATNEEGCFTISSVSVLVEEPPVSPPNAFTPNNDGIHDNWEIPVLKLYPECIVEVYNRVGQIVFKSVGYTKPWDGRFNGEYVSVATYYFVIKPSFNLPSVGGSVTVLK